MEFEKNTYLIMLKRWDDGQVFQPVLGLVAVSTPEQ
jgi:hypothetical protein